MNENCPPPPPDSQNFGPYFDLSVGVPAMSFYVASVSPFEFPRLPLAPDSAHHTSIQATGAGHLPHGRWEFGYVQPEPPLFLFA
ncbi:DDB1- and CUL4-associated factor [Trichinella spiralis]|uniref:DDB1- and CUL4-associated factor n=1 Tax=Trichinella spiralis TaxID=6334 RepID=A0ABR3KPM9_TRISP